MLCRRTTAMLRLWRCCCSGRGRWTRGMRRGGPRWPWPPCGATLTAFTPSSARGRRHTPLMSSTDAHLYTWQVGCGSDCVRVLVAWVIADTRRYGLTGNPKSRVKPSQTLLSRLVSSCRLSTLCCVSPQ